MAPAGDAPATDPTPTPSARLHELDALRVFALSFLILYHVGMYYVTDWDWHIKSAYLFDGLQDPMRFLNRWRMDLVFLVSGIALACLLARRPPGRVMRERAVRLLVPLVFGMWVVVPVQPYAEATLKGVIDLSYGEFLVHYFGWSAAKPWPAGAFDGADGVTWTHLWFLPYLLAYSLLVAAGWRAFGAGALARVGAWFDGLRGWRLLVLPTLPFVLYMTVLWSRFPDSHGFFDDWFLHAKYLTVFVMGVWIGRGGRLWAEATRLRAPLLAGALAIWVAYALGLELAGDAEPDAAFLLAVRWLRALYAWTMLLALLGWARHLFSGEAGAARLGERGRARLAYLTEAVFPWYVLHQSLIILIGLVLAPHALGPVLEPALVLSGTLLGCVALHELLIRRVGWLRPLFGLASWPVRT